MEQHVDLVVVKCKMVLQWYTTHRARTWHLPKEDEVVLVRA